MQIVVKQLALGIARFRLELLDFRIDVAVTNENVGPAVIVEIEEAATPAQILRVRAQPCSKGVVFETSSSQIVIERWSVAGEVGLDQVEVAVKIKVSGGDAHARRRLACAGR